MIHLSELTEADVGRWVKCNPGHGPKQKGRIKSWNDKFVFVVYLCDDPWQRFADYGCATTPEDLDFESE